MADTRKKGMLYLKRKLGNIPKQFVSASRFFPPENSWTGKEAWWFNLPIKKVKSNKKGYYYLLGAKTKKKSSFVILKVPIAFLISNLSKFETRYDDKIMLHLAAYRKNWLVDERGKGRVDFSPFELK